MDSIIRSIRRFLGKVNGKKRWLFFIAIICICIIAISFGIYVEFYSEDNTGIISIKDSKKIEEYTNSKNNFNSLFTNELKTNIFVTAKRKNSNKDIVYTGFDLSNEDESYYSINTKIPTINIDNEKIDLVNEEIRSEFYDEANSIMRQNKSYIVYNVSYVAFVNENILSIAVKASYKKDASAERLIIKTYNLNINTNEKVKFEDILAKKGITDKTAQKEINSGIKIATKNAKSLSKEYDSVYQRDESSEMYKIENAENYFYTNDGTIYLIYPYGNTENTNEFDLIIF